MLHLQRSEQTSAEDEVLFTIGKRCLHLERSFGGLDFGDTIAFDRSLETLNLDIVASLDLVVIIGIGESEGDDAKVDEIGAVDALDRLGDNRLDSEIHRAKRGVFAARTLTVALAGDDDIG